MKKSLFRPLAITLALFAGSAHAQTAFLTGSVVSGMNRICYYNYLGNSVAITIRATSICPLSIQL